MTIEEAISELKDIFIHALEFRDIRTQRAFDMAIEALEAADKYRWHDLQKDPTDLPSEEERVVLTLDLVEEHRNAYGCRAKDGTWVVNGFVTRLDVIAWRIDEPFEEVEE